MREGASVRGLEVDRVIDTYFSSGIISVRKWLRSSMAEQLPLKQLVEGSNPPGVTKITKSRTFVPDANVRD